MSSKRRETSGVIDRIVDGQTAVILVEEEGKQFDVAVEQLPPQAGEGSWLRLEIEADEIMSIAVDTEMTRQMQERIHRKTQRLRSKRKTSKFQKK